ncbi:MAG: transcriptional regulator, partial [Clostridia bacterium]|nr:transcriptional regulator [Clostridia bacterium]
MEAIFLKLFNLSLTASWLVLAVIILRLILNRAPKFLRCILWGLVGLRLILPFSFESVLSLIPSSEPLPKDFIYTSTPAVNTGIPVIDNAINPVITRSLTPDPLVSINPTQVLSLIASAVWIFGLALMLTYMLISYLQIRIKVRESVVLYGNVRLCDRISSPFILGIIKPKIYLPSNMTASDFEYVIAHENAHLKRCDHWWKPLGFLLLCVYWFNPVMWTAYLLLCRDIELACDERVIKQMDPQDKKAYSSVLLNCSTPRKMISACPLAFGESGVKSRVKSILNYKKPAFWIILIAIIASIVTAVCFLTDPES